MVVLGLAGAVILSVAAGAPTGSMPGVALGSVALLLAERTMALFTIWMVAVVVIVRALRNQVPSRYPVVASGTPKPRTFRSTRLRSMLRFAVSMTRCGGCARRLESFEARRKSVSRGSEAVMARLNAMCRSTTTEDQIFELLGEMKTPGEIVRELGLDPHEGHTLVWKVIAERDTPNAIAIRAAIDRAAAVRF